MPGETITRAYRPRALPRPVRPFPDETLDSFLQRLATGNHIPGSTLRRTLVQARLPLTEALAAATGRTETDLRRALPDLRTPDDVATDPALRGRVRAGANQRAVCQICAAAHPSPSSIRIWTTHDDLFCIPHHRWLGMNSHPSHQFDLGLGSAAATLAARRKHRWLISNHGRERVRILHEDAHQVVQGWHRRGVHPARSKEAHQTLRQNHPRLSEPLLLEASWYPTVVALIPVMLATPPLDHCRSMTVMEPIYDRVAAEVTDGYSPNGAHDPFITWLHSTPWRNKFPETLP